MQQQHGSGDAEGPHQVLFKDYLNNHVTVCPEPGPCRDEDLLSRAAQVLLQHPVLEPSCPTLTRLYPLLMKKTEPKNLTHLSDLVRATELLETFCLNLYLQPWRREIRSVKTFTGPFVYYLVPALGTNTLQSILANIGYLPQESGPSPSEYSLSEEASQERALQVAFELLLTRALCLHLPQLDQHAVQKWVECLKCKLLPAELSLCTENTSDGPKERTGHKTEEEPNPDTSQREPGLTEDQSISPLHVTYPDLVFRGRPLLQDHDSTTSQPAVLSPKRRHAQKLRPLPLSRPTNKDNTGEEGLSGPVGLSLHITLRPQVSGFSTCGLQDQTADIGGLCENNSPVLRQAEEKQRHQSKTQVEPQVTADAEELTQGHPTSTGSESEEDSL